MFMRRRCKMFAIVNHFVIKIKFVFRKRTKCEGNIKFRGNSTRTGSKCNGLDRISSESKNETLCAGFHVESCGAIVGSPFRIIFTKRGMRPIISGLVTCNVPYLNRLQQFEPLIDKRHVVATAELTEALYKVFKNSPDSISMAL